MGELGEIMYFVHGIWGTFGSCFGYCEICKKSHPGCGGDKFDRNQKCPDNCNGDEDTFYITDDWAGRQVGECCFERVFRPLKELLDARRDPILEYYAKCLKEEREKLTATEALIDKTVRNK